MMLKSTIVQREVNSERTFSVKYSVNSKATILSLVSRVYTCTDGGEDLRGEEEPFSHWISEE